MFGHFLTITFRNLIKNRFYSVITVTGLALGLASVFLIVQYLKVELSYDRFHKNPENIYRIIWENQNPQTRTPHPMAQAMVQDFPEVESAVSLSPVWGPGLMRQTFSIRNPEKDVQYDETSVLAVDSTFFKVFSFQLIKGDPRTALTNSDGILISESAATKYFGTTDVIGKQLELNENKYLVQVLGVFRDVPESSHFHFDFLISYAREKLKHPDEEYYQWSDFGHFNYIRLKPGSDAKKLESKLLMWSKKYINYSDADLKWLRENNYGFRLQPVTSIHLHSHLRWELESNGNIAYVYLMSVAALLILIIGVVNFVNLSLAQTSERAKEIGIRKSLGAFRRQLTFQFLGESLLMIGISMLLAVVIIEVSLPMFHSITGKLIPFELGHFAVLLVSLGLMVASIAGIFPALYLSAMRPALILKDKLIFTKGIGMRRVLIIFQFATSMTLISASVIISQQLDFLEHKDLGFNAAELIVLPIKDRSMNSRLEELRSQLLQINGVSDVSAASNIPGKSFDQNPIYAAQNPEERIDASEEMIDPDFLKVMNMTIVEGRTFLKGNPADSKGFILNEIAVRQLGLKNPIGKEIVWERDDNVELKGPVIGVVKDFHFQSLHEPLRPLLMRMEDSYNFAIVKINTADFKTSIRSIESTWHKFDNRYRFEFSFLDSQLNQLYEAEQNMMHVLDIFSFIGIVIASSGLLGVAALTFRQRTKEVSIRKVLGATLPNLIMLLLKDFTLLILTSIAVAVPLIWWMMQRWLENFSYRISINPMVFVVIGLGLVLIVWVTLSFLTLQTARVNPAETLKSE